MHWNFVIAGYGLVGGGLILYTTWLIRQGRELSKRIPPERRRFLD